MPSGKNLRSTTTENKTTAAQPGARAVMRILQRFEATRPSMLPFCPSFPARRIAAWGLLILATSTTPLFAADSTLSELVKRFTEKRAGQTSGQPAAQTVAPSTVQPAPQLVEQPVTPTVAPEVQATRRLDSAAQKPGTRKPSPSLSSLPPLKASGPRRILLVDDDWDGNTVGARPSGSDKIFRELVAAAVGGDAAAWSTEMVETYQHGPAFERLRDFNVVVWYTGGSYGGGFDGRSTLSVEDEKIVRRYLQEVGGAFILVSPGFLTTRTYATTWTESDNPFLKEVMGVNGIASLVRRFEAGTVHGADRTTFQVEAKGVIETQFSAINPDGAAVVFTSTVDARKTMEGPVPVAVAHPFGGGRFVYVGFSFENITEALRTKAFDRLLEAATGSAAAAAPAPTRVVPTVLQNEGAQQRIVEIPPAPSGPPVASLEISGSYPGMHSLRWIATLDTGIDQFEVYRRDANGWRFLRGGFRENFFHDPSYVAPGSAYKVVAVYRDGRRGEAVVEYPNPPQPQAPTGLRVVQTGTETVQIDWVNVPGVGKYRVYGPGAPDAGLVVTTGTLTEPGYGGRTTMQFMPIGIHEIRVAAEYAPGPAPTYTSANVAVNSDRGRYRLVFRGLKVTTPVNDDIIDADGRGNEIYAAAYWATAPLTSGTASQGGFARTLVHGDTTNFPNRVRAGSAGPTGGLRAGDIIPAITAPFVQPGVAGESDRFPLKIWEGELVEGGPIVAVIPIVFEWNATNHTAWDYWANYWSSTGNTMEKLAGAMRQNLSAPLAAQPLHGTTTIEDPTKTFTEAKEERPLVPGFTVAADRDRPIGLIHVSPPRAFVLPDYGHKTVGFALTRRRVEAALAGQPHLMLQITWSDVVSGNYTGYFQLERLSEPPLVAPPPPTVAPVIATGTILVPGLVGTAVPGQPASPPPAAPPTPTLTRTLPAGEDVAGRTIKPLEEPPPGPPPANVTFGSDHAARHMIRWQGYTGATFDVYRKSGDQFLLVTNGTTFAQTVDESFVAPGTVYRIAARYPDGRYGHTDVTFANPAQPAVVTELKMTQTGERKARLTWKWTSTIGSSGVRVFAPGLPPEGQMVPRTNNEGSYEVAQVPEGAQLFRVAYEYGNKVAPVEARLNATMATWSGQYRAVLLGFRVGRKTVDDDIFDGDGRGDEVFFAAYRALITNPSAGTVVPIGAVQSAVYGDINRFPTRIRAGGAGPTGGVRSGDVIPSEAALAAQPGVMASADRLPFLLWEGTLRNDGSILALGVSGLEWDNTSTAPLNSWIGWWDAPNGRSGLVTGARDAVQASPDTIRYVPFAVTYEIQPDKPLGSDRLAIPPPVGTPREKRYTSNLYYGAPLATRPIGIIKSSDPRQWYYVAHGFALTRRNIEATLGGNKVAVVSASLATRRGPDVDKPEEQDEAQYTIYVQIERISAPPIAAQ